MSQQRTNDEREDASRRSAPAAAAGGAGAGAPGGEEEEDGGGVEQRSPVSDNRRGGSGDGLGRLDLVHSPYGLDDGSRDIARSLRDDINSLNDEIFRSIPMVDQDDSFGHGGPLDLDSSHLHFGSGFGARFDASTLGLKAGGGGGGGGVGAGGAALPSPPLDGHLARGLHAFSNGRPSQILESVSDAAQAAGADLCPRTAPFLAKMRFYREGYEIEVNARVHLSPRADEGRFALEFQKVRGDSRCFWEVYRELMDVLVRDGVVRAPPVWSFADGPGVAPAFPKFDDSMLDGLLPKHAVTDDMWDSSADALVGMALAPRAHTQCEGLRALSEDLRSKEDFLRAVLRNPDAFGALVGALASTCRDVHRLAARCLVSLAKAGGSDYPRRLAGSQDAVRGIVALLGHETLEVRREAVRLLVALSGSDASLLQPFASEGLATHVQRMTCSPDPFLRRQAEVLRTRFMD